MSENPSINQYAGTLKPALTALTIALLFILVPLVGEMLVFLLPAPIAYQRYRNGDGIAAVTAAGCIGIAAVGGSFFLGVWLAGMATAGYLLGGFLRRGSRPDLAVAVSTASAAGMAVILAGVWFLSAGKLPSATMASVLDESMKQSVLMYRQVGMSEADIQQIMPVLKMYAEFIRLYMPAMIACAYGFSVLVTYGLTRGRLIRDGALDASSLVPLSRWTSPDALVWAVIVPGFLMMIPGIPVLRTLMGNVLLVAAAPYLAQGFGLVFFFFEKLKLTRLMRGLGYVVILFQPYLILGIWTLGLFDTWADFRKLRAAGVKPA